MAKDCGVSQDDEALFNLALASSLDRAQPWGTPQFAVVVTLCSLDYCDMRGAQGNGSYYLFMPVETGFQFAGKMGGNRYKWTTVNGSPQFVTGHHMSASQSYETIYDWNGTMFKETSNILYEYAPDGTRKEIEDF